MHFRKKNINNCWVFLQIFFLKVASKTIFDLVTKKVNKFDRKSRRWMILIFLSLQPRNTSSFSSTQFEPAVQKDAIYSNNSLYKKFPLLLLQKTRSSTLCKLANQKLFWPFLMPHWPTINVRPSRFCRTFMKGN